MDREALQERDPAAAVADLEADRARALPLAAGVGLDHEPTELLRLRERAVDLVEQVAAIAGARRETAPPRRGRAGRRGSRCPPTRRAGPGRRASITAPS